MTESEPQNRRLGYARVSTYGQTLGAQIAQLRAEECAKIYQEKASGTRPDRRNVSEDVARRGDQGTVRGCIANPKPRRDDRLLRIQAGAGLTPQPEHQTVLGMEPRPSPGGAFCRAAPAARHCRLSGDRNRSQRQIAE